MPFIFIIKRTMIDLHCHSYFSDGALSPKALLHKALESELRIFALTDHDTTEGLSFLQEEAKGHDIQIINGIELSVRFKKYDLHILGLKINPEDPGLRAIIAKQNDSRIKRAHDIAHRLSSFGVSDAYQKACTLAGHERVGRAHFAQILIAAGIVKDMKTAFKRFLGAGRPAYVPTDWVGLDEAVSGIIEAGGQAVIAHPLKYGLTRTKLHELIHAFKKAGGVGMEVVSGAASDAQVKELAGLCQRFKLLASSGSDYHGDALSYTKLGRQQPLPVNCTPIWEQWTTAC